MTDTRLMTGEMPAARSPDPSRPILSVVGGIDLGLTVDLSDEATLGRTPDCSLSLQDRLISRLHCRVERTEEGFLLLDCNSSNGTFVNGARAGRHLLAQGDKIRIGNTIIAFLDASLSPEETAAQVSSVLSSPEIVPGPDSPELSPSFVSILSHFLGLLADKIGASRVALFSWDGDEEFSSVVSTIDLSEESPASLEARQTALETVRVRGQVHRSASPVPALGIPVIHGSSFAGVLYAEADGAFRPGLPEPADRLKSLADVLAAPLHAIACQRRRRLGLRRAAQAVVESTRVMGMPKRFGDLLGRSPAMERVLQLLAKVAASDAPVLIEGETGTGKELVARAIHTHGDRREGPFVAENCAAIAPSLMESEIFGHVKGAFTGAERDKAGLFELAHGGSLFLDEIADMSEDLQKKLLRVIQEGVFRRVGGSEPVSVNVRILAASNRSLDDLVKAGRFREDLYFRLNVLKVSLPALRDRPEDVWPLAEHFLADISRRQGTRKKLSQDAVHALLAHPWPGNVRELRNAIERAALLCEGDLITSADLGLILQGPPPVTGGGVDFKTAKMKVLDSFERRFLLEALVRNRGNISSAADEVGLERAHLYTLLKKHRLDADRFRR